jgi:hypothetical protein
MVAVKSRHRGLCQVKLFGNTIILFMLRCASLAHWEAPLVLAVVECVLVKPLRYHSVVSVVGGSKPLRQQRKANPDKGSPFLLESLNSCLI